MSDQAAEAKAKGNAAFSAGNYSEAVEHFTQAIKLDGHNHVLYSNRSAAFAGLKEYEKALEDANKCIEIKPDWARGYSRKGAAEQGLGNFDAALQSYKAGLQYEPGNATLQNSMEEMEKIVLGNKASTGLASLFQRPDLISIIMGAPELQPYLAQPDFMQMVQNLQKNPSSFHLYQSDPRCMMLIQILLQYSNPEMFRDLAAKGAEVERQRQEAEEKRREEAEKRRKAEEEAKKPKIPVDDNEIAALDDIKIKSEAYKTKGTNFYKERKFAEAVKYYTLAYEADESNVACLTNRAAVHYEAGDLDAAEKDCREAIQKGREIHVDFKTIARAYERLGNIYQKKGDAKAAVKEYENAQLENRTDAVDKKIKELKKKVKEEEELSYINVDQAKIEKEEGNALVKEGKWVEAIGKYSEAIRRNPKDHTIYSNRALVFLKILQPKEALDDCNKALSIDPIFVRAHVRRGNAHVMLKEMTRAYDDYHHALELDATNEEAAAGLNRVLGTAYSGVRDQTVTENALKDPAVKAILSDPIINSVLKDLQQRTTDVDRALRNPDIKNKIEKLMIAGIIGMGPPGAHREQDD